MEQSELVDKSTIIRQNLLFGDWPGHGGANACVGHNGNSQNYENYARGYKLSYETVLRYLTDDHFSQSDSVVYPLVHLARHCIELYIKHLLYSIPRIRRLYIDEKHIEATHDLSILWNKLCAVITQAKDRRYTANLLSTVSFVVEAFTDIDPNGQVFRYPEDFERVIYLKHLTVINIAKFNNSCYSAIKSLEELTFLTYALIDEYSFGKFTKELSPTDITNIAKRLPQVPWDATSGFNIVKATILKEYKLSSKSFSSAVDIIKSDCRLSSFVGLAHLPPYVNVARFTDTIKLLDSL